MKTASDSVTRMTQPTCLVQLKVKCFDGVTLVWKSWGGGIGSGLLMYPYTLQACMHPGFCGVEGVSILLLIIITS